MKIETKYNIEDEVFTMYSDKIVKGRINGIRFIKSNNMCSWGDSLTYNLQLERVGYIDRLENKLFKTKEELIANL